MTEVLRLWRELVRSWVPAEADITQYLGQPKPIRDDQLVALLSGVAEGTVYNQKIIPPGTVFYSGFGGESRTERGPMPQYPLREPLPIDQACALADLYLTQRLADLGGKLTEVRREITEEENLLTTQRTRLKEAETVCKEESISERTYREYAARKERAEEDIDRYKTQLGYKKDNEKRLIFQYNALAKAHANHTTAKQSKNDQAIRAVLLDIMRLAQ